jgi:hypothetical protein
MTEEMENALLADGKEDEDFPMSGGVDLQVPAKLFGSEINTNSMYYSVFSLSGKNSTEMINLQMENKNVMAEIDTGAVVTVCNEKFYEKYLRNKE